MPYIVTIKPPDNLVRMTNPPRQIPVSRRAVATLDEARHEAFVVLISELGGTVGPLPDGTVIEVERVHENVIRAGSRHENPVSASLDEIIAAYNESQGNAS